MIEIKGMPGRYELPASNSIPGKPSELPIARYTANDGLGDPALEEAAARVLMASVEAGQWVGIDRTAIDDQIEADHAAVRAAQDACERNRERREIYLATSSAYRALSILTLGVYALFVKRPTLEVEPVPERTSIALFDHQRVVNALDQLVKNFRLLQETAVFCDGQKQVILFPTPKLVWLFNTPGAWRTELPTA